MCETLAARLNERGRASDAHKRQLQHRTQRTLTATGFCPPGWKPEGTACARTIGTHERESSGAPRAALRGGRVIPASRKGLWNTYVLPAMLLLACERGRRALSTASFVFRCLAACGASSPLRELAAGKALKMRRVLRLTRYTPTV